jgi:hypothetical protein
MSVGRVCVNHPNSAPTSENWPSHYNLFLVFAEGNARLDIVRTRIFQSSCCPCRVPCYAVIGRSLRASLMAHPRVGEL